MVPIHEAWRRVGVRAGHGADVEGEGEGDVRETGEVDDTDRVHGVVLALYTMAVVYPDIEDGGGIYRWSSSSFGNTRL